MGRVQSAPGKQGGLTFRCDCKPVIETSQDFHTIASNPQLQESRVRNTAMSASVIRSSIVRDAMHTAIAGALTKGVGSGFRIYDDRHAPKDVKRNTIRREAITVGQVSVYSFMMDTLGQKVVGAMKDRGLVNKQWLANIARHKTLLKIAPISAGIFLAEVVGRKFAPRDIWEDPEIREVVSHHQDDDDDDEEAVHREENPFFPSRKGARLSGEEPLQRSPITFANNPSAPRSSPSPCGKPPACPPQGLPCSNPFQRVVSAPSKNAGLAPAFSL